MTNIVTPTPDAPIGDLPGAQPKDRLESRIEHFIDAHWRSITTLIWLGTAIVLLVQKAHAIHWFALSDTDDNMRFDQVRDWLGGQGWYDLRQHRLNPPIGFSIHWSRLVDLPLAGLILILKPLLGAPLGYRWACAIAPLLPMLLAFWMVAIVVRRLIAPGIYPLALAILLCGNDALAMWTPLRIDHHGWQLALLMMTVAGLTEPNLRRSGMMIALSSALSLAIGLEMLPYIAFAGAAVALHWAWDRAETERMRSYGITMAVATTLCFLVFASNDNWHDVCDALSPVWLTTVAGAAAMLFAISFAPAAGRGMRLAMVVGAGAIAGGLYVGLFPQCFGHRLEGIPPEAERLWLSHVNEARPVYLHSVSVVVTMLTLPILGTIGSLIAVWRRRGTRAAADWLPVTLFATLATGLTLWQVRTGPSAQMLAVPGATYLAYRIVVGLMQSRSVAVRIGAVAAGLVVGAGLVSSMLIGALPQRYADLKFVTFWAIATGRQAPPAARKPLPGSKPKPDLTKLANRRCPTIPALAPIGRLPAATIFTFIDEGPRLITLTHHSAVGGPYHRNAQAILDIEHAFRGTPDQAHAIIAAHHAAYLLVCPHMSEATIYQAEAPAGFYAKLAGGYTPSWLAPQPLPAGSPYRMWRVVG